MTIPNLAQVIEQVQRCPHVWRIPREQPAFRADSRLAREQCADCGANFYPLRFPDAA